MSPISEIKQAILGLSEEDRAGIVDWLYSLAEEEWDRQIAADSAAGRLDFLKEEALEAKKNDALGYL